MRRRSLLAAPWLAAPAIARGQSRAPIRVLVGFAPGGSVDQSVRIPADAIARRGGPVATPAPPGSAASARASRMVRARRR